LLLKNEEKALLRFADKVTSALPFVTQADVKGLRELGWSDKSIFYTIPGCALFNFYTRRITASRVHSVSEECHRLHGRILTQKGYDPQLREKHLGSLSV
jgi:hypothetical protein